MSDKKDHPRPSLTVDNVIIALEGERQLSALFIRRGHDPFAGAWALPGGFVEPNETVAQAAARELQEETALREVRLVELGCFSRPGRDPRGWVVSIAHIGCIPASRRAQTQAGDDAASAAWLDLVVEPGGGFRLQHEGTLVHRGGPISGATPPPGPSALAFDHGDILAAAVERLRDRVGELAFDLLPQPFSLAAARSAFEAILGEPVDPAMFERVLHDGMVRAVTLPTRPSHDMAFVSTPISPRRSLWLPSRGGGLA
jgi:8-oxo-dGTP diphosphatase